MLLQPQLIWTLRVSRKSAVHSLDRPNWDLIECPFVPMAHRRTRDAARCADLIGEGVRVGKAPGWYEDPFHRSQERYWDGRMWTQGTRLVGGDAPPEGAEGSPDGGEGAVASGGEEPAPPDAADTAMGQVFAALSEPGPGSSTAPLPPAPLSFAPLGAPVQPSAGGPSTSAPLAVGTAARLGPGRGGRHRRQRGAKLGIAAAAFVLVLGGVSVAFVFGGVGKGGGGSGQASAAEAVDTAVTQTIDAHSADVSLSMSASATGFQESLTASGAFDFEQKTGTMTMTIPVDGAQYSEQEILDGSTLYVNVSGLHTGLTLSQPWISVPVDQSDSSDVGASTLDAAAILHQLQTEGGLVTSLGQTGYEGEPATEYEATLPPSALESAMGALPSSSGQNTFGLDLPVMTIDVYVTPNGLLNALVVPTYSFDIAGQTISVAMTMSFSNFGTKVTVTPPPANEVEPFQQFLGNSGSTGNSGNTGNSGCGCSNV